MRHDEFRLVETGRHHQIYCDGRRHIRTVNGSASKQDLIDYALYQAEEPKYDPFFDCDCQRDST